LFTFWSRIVSDTTTAWPQHLVTSSKKNKFYWYTTAVLTAIISHSVQQIKTSRFDLSNFWKIWESRVLQWTTYKIPHINPIRYTIFTHDTYWVNINFLHVSTYRVYRMWDELDWNKKNMWDLIISHCHRIKSERSESALSNVE